jgi:hypothetical protein
MKKISYTFFFLVISMLLSAQEFSEYTPDQFQKDRNYGSFNFLHLRFERGAHPSGTDYLQDIFSNGYWGGTLRLGTQSTGRQTWQRLHNYPQYGLGVAFFDLGGAEADSAIGAPNSLFFFFGAPMFRVGKLRLNTDIELGLSYDFKPYHGETNPYQDVIGASTNLHFNMSLVFYYQLSKRLDISLGSGLTHFSNGRSFTPQKGINLIGLHLGAVYNFNPIKNYTKYTDINYQPPIRPEYIVADKPDFKSHHELQFMASVGTVQAEPGEAKQADSHEPLDSTGLQDGPRYGTSSITAEYAYQVARKIKVVGGLDFFYDGSVEYYYDDKTPNETTFSDKSFTGWHLGFHYLIERFAFVGNVGWYINKPFEQRGDFFFRAGGRVGLTEKLDAHICLKTRNGGIADWIEWGIAYKLKL